jgi:hypothetical protein
VGSEDTEAEGVLLGVEDMEGVWVGDGEVDGVVE